MGLFGSKGSKPIVEAKLEPELLVPSTIVVESSESTNRKETTRFYTIPEKYVQIVNGKEYYDTARLRELTPTPNIRWFVGPYDWDNDSYAGYRQLTNGDEYLYAFRGDPHFSVNATTNEVTFFPRFFQHLGERNYRLVRIQAPLAFHNAIRDSQRARVDPEIRCVWKPEYR